MTFDPKDTHVLVTNHLSLQAETVFKRYALRWEIKRIFQDTKDTLTFDQYLELPKRRNRES